MVGERSQKGEQADVEDSSEMKTIKVERITNGFSELKLESLKYTGESETIWGDFFSVDLSNPRYKKFCDC